MVDGSSVTVLIASLPNVFQLMVVGATKVRRTCQVSTWAAAWVDRRIRAERAKSSERGAVIAYLDLGTDDGGKIHRSSILDLFLLVPEEGSNPHTFASTRFSVPTNREPVDQVKELPLGIASEAIRRAIRRHAKRDDVAVGSTCQANVPRAWAAAGAAGVSATLSPMRTAMARI
jgi:hypothetical protein